MTPTLPRIATMARALAALALAPVLLLGSADVAETQGFTMSVILGRPSDHAITLSVLAPTSLEAFVEYGPVSGAYAFKTAPAVVPATAPYEIELTQLEPNTRYYYRLRTRRPGANEFDPATEYSFQSPRTPGSTFAFAVQGDSHPERQGKMFFPDLYTQTMHNVAAQQPDFYLTLGDDFSLDALISRRQLTQRNVDAIYAGQRSYLGQVARSSPLFLVNGNHEEAERVWLDGTPNNPAVMAGSARTRYFPLPAPGGFYTGDTEQVQYVGLLRDYYAWTWGDALFVVIDPYWHSPGAVDSLALDQNAPGRGRDWWKVSIGDEQYQWLKTTLEQSSARYKFVFAHHVLGTGRGGIEMADDYEWGGRGRNGAWEFAKYRPGWEMPIHQLFVKTGVSIFFFGHDHIFAHQERDGVVYQSTPNPADPTFTAFNREAYRSGDILPNSGNLRVTVSPENVRVDYVRSFLPKDEKPGLKNGAVAFSYTVAPRAAP